MPSNKREGIYFGLMMVFGMVSVMYFYNMYMEGLLGTLTFWSVLFNYSLTFIVAFIVETFLVGPIMRGIAFKLPYDKSKKLKVIVAVSTCMVVGMVICMSVYGLITAILSNHLEGSLFMHYFKLIIRNFAVAYPSQLLIVGPLSRWILVKFIKNSAQPKLEYN
ncbi:DUF2798 domain-containing protein [Cohnella endophytica]|uniref:DUF2798 domain-containing protein n=1 Tax=Cohnella endophytica TaxID=2419778 RepID=A0A494YBR4_9BACL|nr:DUF2798 domain-containing protein [Cohnella endophytica]RKP58106.1 DUF2798 domain-containing protein [Cohnella endophytica]